MIRSSLVFAVLFVLSLLAMACASYANPASTTGQGRVSEGPLGTLEPGAPVSSELDSDSVVASLRDQILEEHPGMTLQRVVVKKMTLARYLECIARPCDGTSVHDLVSPERADNALNTEIWAVGFRSTDEIWKMSWYVRPPNVQNMEDARPNRYRGDDGIAISCMAIDSKGTAVLATQLAPSDWIASEC